MTTKTFKLQTIVQVLDQTTRPLRKIGKSLHQFKQRTGLDRVSRAAQESGEAFKKTGVELARFSAIAGAAGGSIFALVKKAANAGDTVAKTADKLGVGVEELQKLRYAADLSGVSTQTFDMALQRFTRRAAEAAAGTGEAKSALAALGIQLTDANGNLRPSETLLAEVADKMAQIEDPAKRVRIAFKLFDSEGVSMVNMLNKGGDAMRKAGAEAVRLGIMTEEEARASEQFNDNVSRLTRVLTYFGQSIAHKIMPHLDAFITHMTGLLVKARPQIIETMKDAFAALGDVLEWIRGLWNSLTAGFSALQELLLLMSPALGWLIGPLKSFGKKIGWLKPAIIALAAALTAKLGAAIIGLFRPLAQLTALLLANPIIAIITGIAVAALLIYHHWSDIVPFFKKVWDQITAEFAPLIDFFKTLWGDILGAFDLVGLVSQLTALDLTDIGLGWIVGLWDGIKSGWSDLMAWLSQKVGALMDWLPDWVKEQIGINVNAGMAQSGGFAAPMPSALPPAPTIKAGGKVLVAFENTPPNMRVREVGADSSDIPLEVNTGYAMAGP